MMTKNISNHILLLALGCSFTWLGCKDTVDLPDQPLDKYVGVYMPSAVNGVKTTNLKISDSAQSITYGANYGGYGYPESDVPVTFKVDNAKADSFNIANASTYPMLPTASYTLSNPTSVIPAGTAATPPLSITVKTKGTGAIDILTPYLLSVSLESSAIKVNQSLSTAFYIVTATPDKNDYPNFDRAAWTVLGFSSEEANGEGPSNGKLKFVFDNDKNTFWHSQWQGGTAQPPHWFTIDLGTEKELHGFSFIDRQNNDNGRPKDVNFKISSDNVTWTDGGTISLESSNDIQTKFVKSLFGKKARYVTVTIISTYGGPHTHLAEFNAF